jgi:hypothetical protein
MFVNHIILLLVNFYIIHDNEYHNVNEFSEQWLCIEKLITDNMDHNINFGRNFNFDLSGDKLHTALLHSFYANLSWHVATEHQHHNSSDHFT